MSSSFIAISWVAALTFVIVTELLLTVAAKYLNRLVVFGENMPLLDFKLSGALIPYRELEKKKNNFW